MIRIKLIINWNLIQFYNKIQTFNNNKKLKTYN